MSFAEETTLNSIHRLLADHRQIANIWSIEDVLLLRPDLTEDQAWYVLQQCRRHYDAGIGLNWDVLECTAEMFFPAPEEDFAEAKFC